jgi:membrane protease YdiL (CAAX protease family)
VLGWIILFVVLLFVMAPLFSGVPQAYAQEASAVLTLVAGLAASAVMLRFVDGLPFGALGFPLRRAAAGESVAGFAAGAGALGLAVAMLVAAGSVRWVADEGTIAEYVATLAGALAFFAVAATSEEVMFRGYAFQAATEGMGPWPTTFLFSALFGAIHAGNPAVSTFGLANIVLAGVMLSVAYLRTRSLWFATAVHLGWNWAMGAVLDLPVSGLQRDAPLLDAVERGADWWTGGAFGPEGGAAGSVALVVAAAWLLRTRRLREAPSTRALGPLVDRRLGPDWPR